MQATKTGIMKTNNLFFYTIFGSACIGIVLTTFSFITALLSDEKIDWSSMRNSVLIVFVLLVIAIAIKKFAHLDLSQKHHEDVPLSEKFPTKEKQSWIRDIFASIFE